MPAGPRRRTASAARGKGRGAIDLVFVVILALSIGLLSWVGVWIFVYTETLVFWSRWRGSVQQFMSDQRAVSASVCVGQNDYGVVNSVTGVVPADQLPQFLTFVAQGAWVILTTGDPFHTNRVVRTYACAVAGALLANPPATVDDVGYQVLGCRTNKGASIAFPDALPNLTNEVKTALFRVSPRNPDDLFVYVIFVDRQSATDDSTMTDYLISVSQPGDCKGTPPPTWEKGS